jgi:hypothetical protein
VLAAFLCSFGAAEAGDEPDAGKPVGAAVSGDQHARPIVEQAALFTADDLLLLEVSAGGRQISDGFGAFSSRAGLFIPVGELSRLLDFALTVDPETKRADGWVISQSRTVSIDLVRGEAQVGGKTVKLPQEAAAFFNDEIYIRKDLVEQILPLKLKADTAAATLTILPTEPLPFQARMEREARRQSLKSQTSGSEEAMVLKTPYAAFTPPSVDVDLNGAVANHAPKATGQAEIRAMGDLAFAGAQLYLATDQTGHLTEGTFLLERKDPDGRIAGPFGATRSDLGDTYTPGLPIGARSVAGRGAVISSTPLTQQVVFNKIDLRGELPAGYEVELYVNEVLRGSQSEPMQGRYEFLSVPLSYGLNVIRMVFYGPRGERREQVQRLNVGGAQLAAGQTTYSFGIVQQGRTVLPFSSDSALPTQFTPGVGDVQVTGMISHGLTNATTVSAGFAQYTPVLNSPREVGMVAVDTSWSGISVQADAARDSKSGSALALGMAGLAGGTSIVARHAEYMGGFRDQLQPLGSDVRPLTRDSTLWINMSPQIWGQPLPIVLHADRGQFVDGKTEYLATAQVSRPINAYMLSSTLSYQNFSSGMAAGITGLTGELDASRIVDGRWQFRGGLGYQLQPHVKLNTLSVTADYNTADRTALHLGVMQTFGSSSQTTFQVGNTWRLGNQDVSLVASYTTRIKEVSIGLHVSLGFLFDPLRHQYRSMGPNVADGGSAVLQAFTDRDGDGRMGPGDVPAPGLVVRGGRTPVTTDAKGEAVVSGLGNGAVAQVEVDTASIEDPYLTPPPRLIRFVPRPGRVVVAPYPLYETGEVELNIVFQRAGEAPRPLSALQMQLVSDAGEVVANGSTEYDGALLLDGLRPGNYALRINPEQAERLHLELAAPVPVVIPKSGGFVGHIAATVTVKGGGAHQTPVATSGPGAASDPGHADQPAGVDPKLQPPAPQKAETGAGLQRPSHHALRGHGRPKSAGARRQAVLAGPHAVVARRNAQACLDQTHCRTARTGARRPIAPFRARSATGAGAEWGWAHWSHVAAGWLASAGELLHHR